MRLSVQLVWDESWRFDAPQDCCPDCGVLASPSGAGVGGRFPYRCNECSHSWTCWYAPHCLVCGRFDDLSVDHLWPRKLGGSDDTRNLRVLCRSCNSSKGARPPDVCPVCTRPHSDHRGPRTLSLESGYEPRTRLRGLVDMLLAHDVDVLLVDVIGQVLGERDGIGDATAIVERRAACELASRGIAT